MNLTNRLQKTTLNIFIVTIVVCTFISILLKVNILNIVGILFVGVLFCVYIFRDEERLIYFTIILALLSTFISQYVSIFANISEVLIILLIIRILYNVIFFKRKLKFDKIITILVIITLVLNTVSYIIFLNFKGGIILYIWAVLKRYAFFVVYIYVINIKSQKRVINNLNNTFKIFIIIQLFITIFQFKMGVNYDNVTGLFGLYSSGDYAQFLFIIFAIYICNKNNKKSNKIFEIFLFMVIIIYAIIAEVKLIFFVLPLIIILNSLLDRKVKNILYIVLMIIGLVFSISIYSKIYKNKTEFNETFINEYLTGSYGDIELNRFNFMKQLKEKVFFEDNQLYIGYGIGAANPSAKTKVLQGPIYVLNKDMKIDWFTLPYLIVESGFIGCILYLSIYLYIFIISLYKCFKMKNNTLTIISVLTIISIIYSSSMILSTRMIIFTWFYISIFLKYSKTNNIILK
ncbi:hypothetical protein [Clostridium baratii]|uniref:hypothetical protein n=1 Tax=Clostridium baratii TaxID=1561 RepID=UPI001C233947|nr:hypothetical protein [Clostridium baratii]